MKEELWNQLKPEFTILHNQEVIDKNFDKIMKEITDKELFFEEYNTKSLEQRLEDGEINEQDYDSLRALKDKELGNN